MQLYSKCETEQSDNLRNWKTASTQRKKIKLWSTVVRRSWNRTSRCMRHAGHFASIPQAICFSSETCFMCYIFPTWRFSQHQPMWLEFKKPQEEICFRNGSCLLAVTPCLHESCSWALGEKHEMRHKLGERYYSWFEWDEHSNVYFQREFRH